jgi:hypothetical protein
VGLGKVWPGVARWGSMGCGEVGFGKVVRGMVRQGLFVLSMKTPRTIIDFQGAAGHGMVP